MFAVSLLCSKILEPRSHSVITVDFDSFCFSWFPASVMPIAFLAIAHTTLASHVTNATTQTFKIAYRCFCLGIACCKILYFLIMYQFLLISSNLIYF